MRIFLFLLLIAFMTNTGLSQQTVQREIKKPIPEQVPSINQMQGQLAEAVYDLNKQIADFKNQIAEAKKNNDDPESISQMEQHLATLQQMLATLEKTSIPGNKTPKTLPAAKNTEPPYVSPFTPIKLKQPAKAPTWAQATDELLWYRGKSIDANTLITPSGLVVRFNPTNNTVTLQPDRQTDTPYYSLVKTLGQIKQLKTDFAGRMENTMNSFFMFPQIEEAYDEYELFKNRYYLLAKNTIQISMPQGLVTLEELINQLDNDIRNLPPVRIITPPKRPNDLCLCDDKTKRKRYQKDLQAWNRELFKEETDIYSRVREIYALTNYHIRNSAHRPSNSSHENLSQYIAKCLQRKIEKLSELANQYEQGDVLIEDGLSFVWYNVYIDMLIFDEAQLLSSYQLVNGIGAATIDRVKKLIKSGLFQKYIEYQKSIKNYTKVFDYALYTAHELNKNLVNGNPGEINKNLYDTWIQGLKNFNRFRLRIVLDFNVQQLDDNNKLVMEGNGLSEIENDFYISLGKKDCHWILYPTDVDHGDRNAPEEQSKIPMKVISGKKDFPSIPRSLPYTGPAYMKMVFPVFNINFCGDGSTVTMQTLSYSAADIQRHKNDKLVKMYTVDMLQFANKMFTVIKKIETNAAELVRTSVEMMNINPSQLPTPSGDPAKDRLSMGYEMNKKRNQLQYRLSQAAHTTSSDIKLTKKITDGAFILFNTEADMVELNQQDKNEFGIVLTKGKFTIKILHAPR